MTKSITKKSLQLGLCLAAAFIFWALPASSATILVTSTAASGTGTLSAALIAAFDAGGSNTIAFNLSGSGPFSIAPTNALIGIVSPTLIDGTTQPGYSGTPLIQITGTNTSGQTAGLRFEGGASTLRGVAINGFPIQQIELDSPSNVIQGCYIGTDVTGTKAVNNPSPNANNGILIKSAGNLIGGLNAGNGNVISGNVGANAMGIDIVDAGANVVQGNLIGVAAGGTNILGNKSDGIGITGGSGNLIGGLAPGARNIISGNGASGIYLISSANNNLIEGNYVGTDISGAAAMGNTGGDAVTIMQSSGNLLMSNVFSANSESGVSITGPNATSDTVAGNNIGTDVTGQNKLANTNHGVLVDNATDTQIGGTNAGAGNLISGNAGDGIYIYGESTGTAVEGNYIGVNASGSVALGNAVSGVYLSGAVLTVIGGGTPSARNVISGNANNGVNVNTNSLDTVIQGNFIGLNAAGSAKIGNGISGVLISGATGTYLGGTASGQGNVISGNANYGVYLNGSAVTNNFVEGNYIGADATGTVALGNTLAGVCVQLAAYNQIGGTNAGAGNLISGNGLQGMLLTNACFNAIQGNLIGTAINGTNNLGNFSHGIDLQVGSISNVISGNKFAWSEADYSGVRVRTGAYCNLISGNDIFENGPVNGYGIDLGNYGINLNIDCENGVPAGAANNDQNYPVLTNAMATASTTLVRGYLDSAPGKTYRLEFFGNPAADPSGYGQGQEYLGYITLTLGSGCTSNFAALLPTNIPAGWAVSATATDPTNNTSDFAADVIAYSPPALKVSVSYASYTNADKKSVQASGIGLAYTNQAGPLTVQQTFSLTPPVNWTAMTNQPQLTNGSYYVTGIPSATNVFYRLTAP